MAISFPLAVADLADILPVGFVSFELGEQQELSGLGGGELLAADLGPRLWQAQVRTPQLSHDAVRRLKARFLSLDGALNAFELYDTRGKFPQGDPGGTILGASTPSIDTLDANNKAMKVDGLPAGYALRYGDFISFLYASGAKRALHMIVEDATADGSGLTPLFEVRPHIRPGATTSTAVLLVKATGRFKLMPGTLATQSVDLTTSQLSFTARQTLA